MQDTGKRIERNAKHWEANRTERKTLVSECDRIPFIETFLGDVIDDVMIKVLIYSFCISRLFIDDVIDEVGLKVLIYIFCISIHFIDCVKLKVLIYCFCISRLFIDDVIDF